MLDLQKPLLRGLKLKINGSFILITFQYEKLPKFCFRCGAIMDDATGCPERHDVRAQNATVQYGPWMRAPSPTRKIEGTCTKATSPTRKDDKNFGRPVYRKGAATHDHHRHEDSIRSQSHTNQPEYGQKSHYPFSGENKMKNLFQEGQTKHKGVGAIPGQSMRGIETSMESNKDHQYFPPNGNCNVADSAGDIMGDDRGLKIGGLKIRKESWKEIPGRESRPTSMVTCISLILGFLQLT